MKKSLSLIAILLLAAAAASAQTLAVEQEESGAKRSEERWTASARVLRVGPSTTYLKNGLSLEEVVRLLGKPDSRSERVDGEVQLTTCSFTRSGGRLLVAEFENGVLVASHIESA